MTLPYDHAGYADTYDACGLVLRKSDIFRALLFEGRKTPPLDYSFLSAASQVGRQDGGEAFPMRLPATRIPRGQAHD